MTAGELQKECARRGLPSSRAAKAVMAQRLTDHDAGSEAAQESAEVVEVAISVTPETVPALFADPDPDPDAGRAAPHVFRQTFDAEPGGPDEETHLAYRQATVQGAIEAGLSPRGDARLADNRDGMWVYEVSVRQETLS